MDFYRASQKESKYIKSKKSLIHNTALIASQDKNIIAVLEYEIKSFEEAEIVNFNITEDCKKKDYKEYNESDSQICRETVCNRTAIFKGFMNEIKYWNPYLKRILCKSESIVGEDILKDAGFNKNSKWVLYVNDYSEVFRIDVDKITPEQLTVDRAKLDTVSSWIEKPEDVIITCVKIKNKIVCIDGYSRLLAAYNKGFKYVYAHFEKDTQNDDMQFFETCLKWCEDENIFTIKDLTKRIVSQEEHKRLWGDRCQAYLKGEK